MKKVEVLSRMQDELIILKGDIKDCRHEIEKLESRTEKRNEIESKKLDLREMVGFKSAIKFSIGLVERM